MVRVQRLGLVAAWVIVTVIATAGAWRVVGAAESEVSNAPLTPLIATSAADEPGSAPSSLTSTSSTSAAGSSSVPGSGSSTATTSSSSTAPGSSSSSSSISPSSTTTSSPAASTTVPSGDRQTISVPTVAGTVTAAGVEPELEIVAVVAVPGWSYSIDSDEGRIEVTFEAGDDLEIEVRIRWRDGRLVAEIGD